MVPSLLSRRIMMHQFRQLQARWTTDGDEKARYSQILNSDDNDGNIGNRSSGEDLLETNSQKTKLQTHQRRGTWGRYVAVASATMNIVLLLGLYLALEESKPMQNGHTVFPPVEYETRVFDPVGMLPNAESDAIWDKDVPIAGGATIIEDPEKLALPPGAPYRGGFHKYGVSWAHQYHCLQMLRDEFFSLLANTSNLVGVEIKLVEEQLSPEERHLWHMIHCYGYLRQIVVCNMDMTLEYPTGIGVKKGTVDGYDIPHQCVKREVFDEYMIQHKPEKDKSGYADH